MFRSRRSIRSLVIAVGLLALLALPGTASATATGCTTSLVYSSCVRVVGTDTYVETVTGGLKFTAAATRGLCGRHKVWGDGFSYLGARRCHADDYRFGHTEWGGTWTLNRRLARGSKVCSKFIKDNGDDLSAACVTIG